METDVERNKTKQLKNVYWILERTDASVIPIVIIENIGEHVDGFLKSNGMLRKGTFQCRNLTIRIKTGLQIE